MKQIILNISDGCTAISITAVGLHMDKLENVIKTCAYPVDKDGPNEIDFIFEEE